MYIYICVQHGKKAVQKLVALAKGYGLDSTLLRCAPLAQK